MSVDLKSLKSKTLSPFSKPSKYCRVYSKNYEKALALEFELDRSRDMIMKLKNDLSNKNKEIHLLKINKITIEEEHSKTLKTLREFLKNSDKLTKEAYKTIERNVNENRNIEQYDQHPESEHEENFPSIKKKIKTQNKNKKLIKDFIKIDSLKQHIYSLNEELNKKNTIITELKNNKKATGYKELQNNFLNSCNEIKEIRKENDEIKSHIDDITNLLIMERDDNKILKNKLKEFKQRFELFKELSINKVKQLDNALTIAKEKERNFIIKKNGEKSKEKYEDYIKTLEFNEMKKKINEYQMNMKKNNEIIRQFRTNNFEKKEENKKLKNDKDDLINQNRVLIKENEEMKNQIKELQKKIKNYEKEEKKWKEKEKENNNLKKEIEKLKKTIEDMKNKDKIFFTDIENNKNNTAHNEHNENVQKEEIKNEENKKEQEKEEKKDEQKINENDNKQNGNDNKEKKEEVKKEEIKKEETKNEDIKKEENENKNTVENGSPDTKEKNNGKEEKKNEVIENDISENENYEF